MRLNDLSDGSIKTLLILGLLFANIGVVVSQRGANLQPLESSPAARTLSETPSAARVARALSDRIRP